MGKKHSRRRLLSLAVLGGAAAAALVAVAIASSPATDFTGVGVANTKATGVPRPNVLPPELAEHVVAQGSMAIDHPADPRVPYYGYDDPAGKPLEWVPTSAQPSPPADPKASEAQKTEPDKNLYLVLDGQTGADSNYAYGTHFLYQGHEAGSPGVITRINLDADAAHRVTQLATKTVTGADLPAFDGITWDPWAQRLLLTFEGGSGGGVWASTLDGKVENLQNVLGKGGYEAVQNDSDGNVWIVEDTGGANGSAAAGLSHARQPNSFVYRFVPDNPRDLGHGVLQALQVWDNGSAITFHSGQADADILSQGVKDIHTYGLSLPTKWVTLPSSDPDWPDANKIAKKLGATPFKRPENGQFRPNSKFKEFYFDETGDTDSRTEAGSDYGGFGSVLKLTQSGPSASTGTLSLVFEGDVAHSAFDNVAFLTDDRIVFVEDRGDTLHGQSVLDSAWVFDVTVDYSTPASRPVRLLAQGRDPSATTDSALGAYYSALSISGFPNDGDNEITGIHVSDGDPTANGILGAKQPRPWEPDGRWRVFYTQQHGDNTTYEITRR